MDIETTRKCTLSLPRLGFSLDWGRMGLTDEFIAEKTATFAKAAASMHALEAGAVANPDEHRQVGHYWLRAPELAPTPKSAPKSPKRLMPWKLSLKKSRARKFKNVLVIGIGGSALGSQFTCDALRVSSQNALRPIFFDNTDPTASPAPSMAWS
jgi:glucose-6-phosphate isomerase